MLARLIERHFGFLKLSTITIGVLFVIAGSLQTVNAQTVVPADVDKLVIEGQSYGLPPPETAVSADALKGFRRTGELAKTAVEAIVLKDTTEATATATKIKVAKTSFKASADVYAAARRPIDLRSEQYNKKAEPFLAEVQQYEGEVGNYNALTAEQQTSSEKIRLDKWKRALNDKQAILGAEERGIKKDFAAIRLHLDALMAEKKKRYDVLEALQIKRLQLLESMNEAYGQLEICNSYIKRVDLTEEKFQTSGPVKRDPNFNTKQSDPSLKLLEDSMERLKRISEMGFDGQTKP